MAPTGQVPAEAAADPAALEAGAARAPGHPGHHSGERPWSVTEAHLVPCQSRCHPTHHHPLYPRVLTSGSKVKAELRGSPLSWEEQRYDAAKTEEEGLHTPEAGPASTGEAGPLANHAQSPRLHPTYNKALLEPQEAWPPKEATPSSSSGRTRMHCS